MKYEGCINRVYVPAGMEYVCRIAAGNFMRDRSGYVSPKIRIDRR